MEKLEAARRVQTKTKRNALLNWDAYLKIRGTEFSPGSGVLAYKRKVNEIGKSTKYQVSDSG